MRLRRYAYSDKRRSSVLISVLITLSLAIALCGPLAVNHTHAQLPPIQDPGPLPTPTPITPPNTPQPPFVPQHPLPATVPPPHPAAGVPAPMLPNLDVARRLSSFVPTIDQGSPVPIGVAPICDDNCGGDEPPGGGGYDPDFSTARTRPRNETGEPGVDLGSRNFNWSVPLVSLSGRAGLDLNLTLYYNSLAWTREGSAIRFNSDRAFPGPGPGFTLGFPKVQQRYLNQDYSVYSYMLVTPSGGSRRIAPSWKHQCLRIWRQQLHATNR